MNEIYVAGMKVGFWLSILIPAIWFLENARRTLTWYIQGRIKLWQDEWEFPDPRRGKSNRGCEYTQLGLTEGFYRDLIPIQLDSIGLILIFKVSGLVATTGILLSFIWPIVVITGVGAATIQFLKLRFEQNQKQNQKQNQIQSEIDELRQVNSILLAKAVRAVPGPPHPVRVGPAPPCPVRADPAPPRPKDQPPLNSRS